MVEKAGVDQIIESYLGEKSGYHSMINLESVIDFTNLECLNTCFDHPVANAFKSSPLCIK
jgi:hypothetical protein